MKHTGFNKNSTFFENKLPKHEKMRLFAKFFSKWGLKHHPAVQTIEQRNHEEMRSGMTYVYAIIKTESAPSNNNNKN